MNISIQWPGNLPPAPRAPSSKFASVPYPHQILHRPKLLKNLGQNLPLANAEGDSVWIDAFPGLAKQRRGRGMPTCKWLAARANSFCEQVSRGMSNKAFLSSLLSIKKLPKECAVTSFGQQGDLQKVGFNRLGCMVR